MTEENRYRGEEDPPLWGQEVTIGGTTIREPKNRAAEQVIVTAKSLWIVFAHFSREVASLRNDLEYAKGKALQAAGKLGIYRNS